MSKSGLEKFSLQGPESQVDKRWKKWFKAFEHYVNAEGLTDADRKFHTLLHTVGMDVQEIYDDLPDPAATAPANDDAYKTAVRKLNAYFHHEPNPTFERHIFRQMSPESGEPSSQFAARLRSQAAVCNFGTDDLIDQHIRDQIVATTKDSQLQRQLLAETKLTLSRTLEMYRLHEAAKTQSSVMSGQTGDFGKIHATSSSICSRCNRSGHTGDSLSCPARGRRCSKCQKKGHFAVCCRSSNVSKTSTGAAKTNSGARGPRQRPRENGGFSAARGGRAHEIGDRDCNPEERDDGFSGREYDMCHNVFELNSKCTRSIVVDVKIEGHPLTMEVDTGANVSIVPKNVWDQSWSDVQLSKSPVQLRTFTGEPLTVIGEALVNVQYENQEIQEKLIVVENGANPLLGRNWLQGGIRLDWPNLFVHKLSEPSILDEFPSVFAQGLGTIQGHEAEIHVKDDAKPKCFPSRPLPYAMKSQVDVELDRLLKEGIIEPVDHAEWASPVVVVRKKNGSIRLCGDFKVSVNPHIEANEYPIPNPTDLLASISGATVFSKLDLSQAYAQLPLSKQSQKYCVISTHRGLFACTRLPFGIASAPSIWQRTIEKVLAGLDGVLVYFDDILVCGATKAEHDLHLRQVLLRFQEAGLRLGRPKCELYQSQVRYLGYVVSSAGLHPDAEKVVAITKAATPTDVSSLQSFLGLVNFYSRFVPRCSELLHPLNALLQKNVPFHWTNECEKSFSEIKSVLASPVVLLHYDPVKPAIVECDASPYGLGACLLQPGPDGNLRPVCYVSRSLTAPEKNYSHIEKEALAIVFATKRLHQYLYGRHFTLRTDHKPLVKIFGESSGLPSVTAARLQRWAVILSAYSYTVEYIKGSHNVIADCLSRLPVRLSAAAEQATIHAIDESTCDPCMELPVSASDVAKASAEDPILQRVMYCLMHGWPHDVNSELMPFYRIRNELSVEAKCVLWGNRVIIPEVFRQTLLKELHSDHLGVSRMKSIARSYFWWPKLDAEISELSALCHTCQSSSRLPAKEEVHHWIYPNRPGERIHIDFAELNGSHYLLVVDAYSKWPDVFPMGSNTTTKRTVQCLLSYISTCGIPEVLVSDNGPQFTSQEFGTFCKANGIRHKKTPPYHPASNGQIERLVQELKKFLKRFPDPAIAVAKFLFSYRNTPHSITQVCPSQLMFKFLPNTRFTFLQPQFGADMRARQEHPAKPSRAFEPGDNVYVLNHRDQSRSKWIRGTILERMGPLTYTVRVDSRIRHLHIEHLRRASPEESSSTVDVSSTDNLRVEKPRPSPIVSSPPISTSVILDPVTDPVSSLPQVPDPSPVRRSTRSTRGQAPEKLNL